MEVAEALENEIASRQSLHHQPLSASQQQKSPPGISRAGFFMSRFAQGSELEAAIISMMARYSLLIHGHDMQEEHRLMAQVVAQPAIDASIELLLEFTFIAGIQACQGVIQPLGEAVFIQA